jgi:hypothetical protein
MMMPAEVSAPTAYAIYGQPRLCGGCLAGCLIALLLSAALWTGIIQLFRWLT